jgi:hypothetical protein
VIGALALCPLYLDHPMLVVPVSISYACQKPPLRPCWW